MQSVLKAKNLRAVARPLLLLGVEDALQVTRVEVDEDLVGVDGLVPSVLSLQSHRDGLVRGPVRNNRSTTVVQKKKKK